jgi:WD40 repeat protein
MKTRKNNQSQHAVDRSSRLKGVLELLLIIGLILIIPLFFAIKSVANASVAQATGTPYARTTATSVLLSTPSISASSSIQTNAKEPPACTFPLSQITTSQSASENYTFSEPKVVLTAPQGNLYNIAEWLPDNQQVLMTEVLGHDVPVNQGNLENLELFNPVSGGVKVYATRPETHKLPSWDPALNAVLYPVMNYYDIDNTNNTYKFNRQLWVSYGKPDVAQMLADNLSQLPLAVEPGGGETIYLTDKQISKLDKSLKNISPASFDPTQWEYPKGVRDQNPVSFDMAWQPGTSLIFLYSNNYGGGGYTFILNVDSDQVCELNLGGPVTGAHWSSDGHYLATGRATNSHPADLTLLDTMTGQLTTLVGTPQGVAGQLYINDFIWAPDYHHLLAIGSVITAQNGQIGNNTQGLYLVDVASGQSVEIKFADQFYANSSQSMAWSPDGSKLVVRCPTMQIDRLCFISIQESGQ